MSHQESISLLQLLGGVAIVFCFAFLLYLILLVSLTYEHYQKGYSLINALKKAKRQLK
jgi:hypothetical protein